MIRKCRPNETDVIYEIVNNAARAYAGHIPADCYHEPYMPLDQLRNEMQRIVLYGWEEKGQLWGVMGLEKVKDVTLVRHAYVLTAKQGLGIGRQLLAFLEAQSETPCLLVGTWAGAAWAVDFYRRNGFSLVSDKDRLLRTYWNNPVRQNEVSVVLEKILK